MSVHKKTAKIIDPVSAGEMLDNIFTPARYRLIQESLPMRNLIRLT
jgi:hypothetical protein